MCTAARGRSVVVIDEDAPIGTARAASSAVRGYSLSERTRQFGIRGDPGPRPILEMSDSLTRPAEFAGAGIGHPTGPIPFTAFPDALEGLVASTSGTVT